MTLRTPKRLRGVKTASHARSPKQEKELAERLGGKRVKGSGSGFDKGDVRVKAVALVEAKVTKNNSFSVTREMMNKLQDAACSQGELPILVVEFLGHGKLCVMPDWVLDTLRKG